MRAIGRGITAKVAQAKSMRAYLKDKVKKGWEL
jgi:hypothetical protein